MLNGLNQYSQTVTLPEGTYYCNAAVQYDALNDWPLREVDDTTFLQIEAGGQYELQYEFAGESYFQFLAVRNVWKCRYLVVFSTHCSGLALRNSLGTFRHKQDSTLVAEQTTIFSVSIFLRVNI